MKIDVAPLQSVAYQFTTDAFKQCGRRRNSSVALVTLTQSDSPHYIKVSVQHGKREWWFTMQSLFEDAELELADAPVMGLFHLLEKEDPIYANVDVHSHRKLIQFYQRCILTRRRGRNSAMWGPRPKPISAAIARRYWDRLNDLSETTSVTEAVIKHGKFLRTIAPSGRVPWNLRRLTQELNPECAYLGVIAGVVREGFRAIHYKEEGVAA